MSQTGVNDVLSGDEPRARLEKPCHVGTLDGRAIFGVVFGVALTLTIGGYQFGKSNHTVYLLDAMRQASRGVLEHDWFTTQTFQYHTLFSVLTRWVYRAGIIRAVFFVGYMALALLMHVAWWRLVRALGGSAGTFLASEMLFHLSFGGTGLGMYQFLQDGAFLPSNVASVAMLWGFYFFIARRPIAAGVCLGVASLFHLNYAVVSVVVWVGMMVGRKGGVLKHTLQHTLLGTAIVLICSAMAIGGALHTVVGRSGGLSLTEFVDLYVRLRHPHHYDPSSWPVALWVSFLWPLPLVFIAWRKRSWPAEIGRLYGLMWGIVLAGILFAGVWYVSESLIQMSLYRFSVFIQLFNCIAAAFVLRDLTPGWVLKYAAGVFCVSVVVNLGLHNAMFWPYRLPALLLAAVMGVAVVISAVRVRGRYLSGVVLIGALLIVGGSRGWLGFKVLPEDSAAYLAACDWIGEHTPADAVFLVPPSEESFRLRARRAIVVNFKGAGQLGRELSEWRDRLKRVLDLPDLNALPRPFTRTVKAIGDRYESLPADHLVEVAAAYRARYILVGHRLPAAYEAARVAIGGNRSWFLYDLKGFSLRYFADAHEEGDADERGGDWSDSAEAIRDSS